MGHAPIRLSSTRMTPQHQFDVRIYYEDTDFSGNVYHAAYLKFYERARTEWLRALGVSHVEMGNAGRAFAVRDMQIDFLKPAHIDDELRILTRPMDKGAAWVLLEQEIWRADEKLGRAAVRVACIKSSGGPARLPTQLRDVLSGMDSNR